MKLVDKIADKILEYSFYLLFFAVPLFFTANNFELFEFNKMLLTYGLGIVIVSAWIVRMIAQNKIIFRRSFWDIPLGLFLFSQIISLVFSIDPHTSFFGYYSRFNGGVLSLITYGLLYWALVANFDRTKVFRLLNVTLIGAVLVSIYAIFEHFGHSFSCLMITNNFDVSCWVQDVQNRVYATLGQPNWLATYLVGLIPLTWTLLFSLKCKVKSEKLCRQSRASSIKSGQPKIQNYLGIILFGILFSTLLFTKSRSALIGFAASFGIFWLLALYSSSDFLKSVRSKFSEVLTSSEFVRTIRLFLITGFFLSLIALVIGTPWSPSLKNFQQTNKTISTEINNDDLISPQGGTESGEIRMIVWKGAVEIWKHYPLLGTGPETFAYSYYWYRPREHNDISEWDFLYNKAHNEYLNYAATTGTFGLVTYLVLIGSFIVFSINKLKTQSAKVKTTSQNSKLSKYRHSEFTASFRSFERRRISASHTKTNEILHCVQDDKNITFLSFALLSGFLAICVTNFFGFSVVIVNLFIFTIPAISFALNQTREEPEIKNSWTNWQIVSTATVLITAFALLISTINYWRADTYYAQALKNAKAGDSQTALEFSQQAIDLWPYEPIYYDEMAVEAANLAGQNFAQNKQKEKIQELADLAVAYSNQAITTSPYNLNFWKNRTKIFYKLAEIDGNMLIQAENALIQANKIAPTDAKIAYNLGLIQYQQGDTDKAIETLQTTISLKPNYSDAHFALALFYEKKNEKTKAKQELQFILDKIDPNYQQAIDKLKTL